ncbi:MAG TPA: aspartate kinase [Vicinamibacteria bacterium]
MIGHQARVKKYGGTSVGSPERILKVAKDLAADHRRGIPQVVVASAMADTTERLLEMARRVSAKPAARELDMILTTGEQVSIALLAMAVQDQGVMATPLTGAQCGIRTDGNFTRARIEEISTDKILDILAKGSIAIVAGFQGVTSDQEITTLGRGGSDLTATALAAALKVPVCEIYTDVDGVFTADPRLVPEARLLPWISYEEMLEYAASGSQVLHPRSVEVASRFGVPLQVRSAFHDRPGTTVVKEEELEKVAITGVTGDPRIARLALTKVRDVPGVAAKISTALADIGVNIRLIIQGIRHEDSTNDVSLIVGDEDAARSAEVLRKVAEEVGSTEVLVDTNVAKVSIIGSGIASTPGVAGRMFQALAREGINIELISSSEVRIACVIAREQLPEAVRAIHREFDLANLERKRVADPA